MIYLTNPLSRMRVNTRTEGVLEENTPFSLFDTINRGELTYIPRLVSQRLQRGNRTACLFTTSNL